MSTMRATSPDDLYELLPMLMGRQPGNETIVVAIREGRVKMAAGIPASGVYATFASLGEALQRMAPLDPVVVLGVGVEQAEVNLAGTLIGLLGVGPVLAADVRPNPTVPSAKVMEWAMEEGRTDVFTDRRSVERSYAWVGGDTEPMTMREAFRRCKITGPPRLGYPRVVEAAREEARTASEQSANAYVFAAWAALMGGDGMRVNIALDFAERIDPGNRLLAIVEELRTMTPVEAHEALVSLVSQEG